jgi:hypothetical protein
MSLLIAIDDVGEAWPVKYAEVSTGDMNLSLSSESAVI